jgi:hypothetical protein
MDETATVWLAVRLIRFELLEVHVLLDSARAHSVHHLDDGSMIAGSQSRIWLIAHPCTDNAAVHDAVDLLPLT